MPPFGGLSTGKQARRYTAATRRYYYFADEMLPQGAHQSLTLESVLIFDNFLTKLQRSTVISCSLYMDYNLLAIVHSGVAR